MKNFTIPLFYFYPCSTRPYFQQKEKILRFEPHCRAHLPIRCFVLGNNLHRFAAPYPSAGAQKPAARRQRGRNYFSRQYFNSSPRIPPCQCTRNSRQIPHPAQTWANPRKTRRCGMRQRAAELRVRKNTGGIFCQSRLGGRVCFRLSTPPPARGRRRRVPRS